MKIIAANYPSLKLEKSNPEVIEVRVDGMRMMYDTNSMALGLLNDGEEPKEVVKTCGNRLFGFPYHPVWDAPKVHKPTYIVFEPTFGCPLKCSYCFVMGRYEDHGGNLDPQVAISFIENQMDPDPRVPVTIGFFGGEPLMKWNTLKEIVLFFESWCHKNKKIRKNISITTNAVLIDKEKANFIKSHNIGVLVSIDGPKDLHDKYRVYADGRGSFDDVLRGLHLLKNIGHGSRVTLRGTFTSDEAFVLRRVAFLNELCDAGFANYVAVEPAYASESTCTKGSPDHLSDHNLEKLINEYRNLAQWYLQRILIGLPVRFKHFDVMLRRLTHSQHNPSECGSGVRYVTVDHKGNISACHRCQGTYIGDAKNGINEEKRFPWINNLLTRNKKCRSCSYRYLCGGNCRENSIAYGLPMDEPYEKECELTKVRLNFCMWILTKMKLAGIK